MKEKMVRRNSAPPPLTTRSSKHRSINLKSNLGTNTVSLKSSPTAPYQLTVVNGTPGYHVDGDNDKMLCWGRNQLSYLQQTIYINEKLFLADSSPAYKIYGDRISTLLHDGGVYGYYAYSCFSYGGANIFN